MRDFFEIGIYKKTQTNYKNLFEFFNPQNMKHFYALQLLITTYQHYKYKTYLFEKQEFMKLFLVTTLKVNDQWQAKHLVKMYLMPTFLTLDPTVLGLYCHEQP